jgi:hypothetical protein
MIHGVEQLVLQFPVTGTAQYETVAEVENVLLAGLGAGVETDGHDVGQRR